MSAIDEYDMKIDYALVLKQLQHELSGLDERRQALMATIAGMKRLVDVEVQAELFPAAATADNGNGALPPVPPDFFKGKTPTTAYRELMSLWPGEYKPPQIARILLAGGMQGTENTSLVQAIHSVIKRERVRLAREAEAG